MLRVLACVTDQHDLRYVVLAGVICLIACYTATSLMTRAGRLRTRRDFGWLVATAMVTGSGVWATHFVAMLAFRPGLPFGFDLGLTALSILLAIALSGIGYAIALRLGWTLIGGAVVGIAVATMHFTGMLGFLVAAQVSVDQTYAAAALLVGVGLAAPALAITRWRQSLGSRLAGAGLLTLAICALHFTAMTSITLAPDPTIVVPDTVVAPEHLVIFVAVVTLSIIVFGLAGAIVDQRFAQRAIEETERLRSHVEELEHTKLELEAATEQLRAAFDAAEEANRAKSEFLATMSHEIRTPMNGVLGMASTLLSAGLEPRHRESVRIIRESGEALMDILNDILDLSKIEAGKISLEETDFSLAELFAAAETLWAAPARAKALAFATEIDTNGLDVVCADVSRIRQVLHNLISNAIKFTERGGVVVSVTRTPVDDCGGIGLRFAVSDTGIGVPQDQVDRIFKPFVQGDGSTTRKYGGTGLGLSICAKLVALLGGDIGVDSARKVGSTFWFTMRARIGDPQALRKAETPATEPPSAASAAPPAARPEARVLVADDNHVNQKLVGALLAPLGCRIDYAGNGLEALQAVQAARYDVVLMDVQMPELDGIEATRAIRALVDPVAAGVPIVAVTANAMQGDREKYLTAGMNDYISKPIDPPQLLALVRRAVDSTATSQDTGTVTMLHPAPARADDSVVRPPERLTGTGR